MGGKALGFESIRLQKEDFLRTEKEIVTVLLEIFDTVLPTVYYKSKESFGDLDLIVPRPVPDDILDWLKKRFSSKVVVYNGESLKNAMSISFDYQEFQTDLIFVHPDNLDIAHFYYSYNDLNNYVGRIAAQYGMKFGFNGLFYETPEDDFLISKDREKIYTFLGFDYKRYETGFETLDEIFQYIIFSKYFNTEIYQLENLNHINRTRNLKRPNYIKFLDYLTENNLKGGYEKYPSKEDAIKEIAAFFPEANLEWQLLQQSNRFLRREKLKDILNSNLVKDFLQLSNWEIVRQVLDQIYAIPDVDKILVGLSEFQIKDLITAAYEKSKEYSHFEIDEKVVFRTNDHRFINAIVLRTNKTDNTVDLQTDDFLFYTIRKTKVKRVEKWFDFKNQKVFI